MSYGVRSIPVLLVIGGLLAPVRLAAQRDEAPRRLVVMGVSFEGNHAIDDYRLAASISTTESSFFARSPLFAWLGLGQKRSFDEREFRRDVLRLRLLYNQSGYVDAQVDTAVRRTATEVRVRFLIHEGEPVRIASLDVEGLGDIIPRNAVLGALPLAVGDAFNRFLLQASADTLRRLLRDRGFPFVEVFRNFTVNDTARTATVAFEVDPGPRARIGRIQVDGAERLGEGVVRHLIPLHEGALFRQRDLEVSQRDLYRVEAFDYVRVSLADSVAESPADSLVTVLVRVSESALHSVRAGIGYGSVDCFRAQLGWRARSFLGGGRQLDISSRVSKVGTGAPFDWSLQNNVCGVLGGETDPERLKLNWDVTTSFTQPYFLGRRNALQLTFTGERRAEFKAYLREAVGGEVAVTHQTRWDIPVTASWSVTWGRTAAEPAIFCTFLNVCRVDDTRIFTERRVESLVGLRAIRDHVNQPLDPTQGSRITVEGRLAAPIIGSDSLIQFSRGVVEAAFYHRLGRTSVFAWRVRLGTIVPPKLGLSGQNVQFVPPEQRFYAGGPTTVRGYGQNQLGPVVRVIDSVGSSLDTITSPTGGNSIIVANAEFRFPFPGFANRVQTALFVDAGQVIERGNELFPARGVAVTPGLGIRFLSPLGPVRFDVAYNPRDPTPGPLYQRDGQSLTLVQQVYAPPAPTTFLGRLQLHFSVGQAF